MIKKLFNYLTHPKKCVKYVKFRRLHSNYGRNLPDDVYIKKMFKLQMEYELDLENPKTFNEKLQWLKLNDRNKTELTNTVDKYEVKKIVANAIGEKYVIKSLGVFNSFDEINFDVLPKRFVLKTTHDCGGIVLCKDKKSFDKQKAQKFMKSHLKRNYFFHCREWPYKEVKHRILAEEFAGDGKESLIVYKVMCFGGEPKIIQVIQGDKTKTETIDYFDNNWNLLSLKQNFPNSKIHLEKPECLEEMLQLSHILSKHRAFLRVDWYIVDGCLKFSELTYYSDAGFAAFEPKEWDEKFGSWINLPNKNDV